MLLLLYRQIYFHLNKFRGFKGQFFDVVKNQIHISPRIRQYATEKLTTVDDAIITNGIQLRQYQQECIDSIITELSEGHKNKLAISIATGGGKTVVFTTCIPELMKLKRFENDNANGVLILVHRRELATQTIATIQRFNIVDDDRIFLDMGQNKLNSDIFKDDRPFIIVGSVPTLSRNECSRMDEYDVNKFKAVIVDECHHAVSASYMKIFNKMNCSREDKTNYSPYLLGFTATLGRTDKIPLRKVFEKIVFQKNIASLIDENHLCDFDWLKVEIGLNLSDVEIKGGDFKLDSLAKHVNTEKINIIALKTYLKFLKQYPNNFKSLLVFCVNIKHMQDLSALFRANGINAQYVSGETKTKERDSIVKDFKAGKINVLFNCGVFTEGTDIPNIDSIFLLRPTKSKQLLIQMVGRGLRLHDEKEKLIVTDFVDSKSLGLTITSTLGGKPDVISLIGSLSNPGFQHNDAMLPGDVEYIQFKNYKGIQMLEESAGPKQSMPFLLLKNMKWLNKRGILNQWTQVKFDAWATPCGYRAYLKIELNKSKFVAKYYYSKLQAFSTNKKLICTTMSEDEDFDKVVNGIVTFIEKHPSIGEEMRSTAKMELSKESKKATLKQQIFLKNTILPIVRNTMSDALDYDKFLDVFNVRLREMTLQDASNLIFGYTVSRSQSVLLWLKQNFLKNNEQRRLITRSSILNEREILQKEGWID